MTTPELGPTAHSPRQMLLLGLGMMVLVALVVAISATTRSGNAQPGASEEAAAVASATIAVWLDGEPAPGVVPESAVLEPRCTLDRETHVVVWRWRRGQFPQRLYDGALPAGVDLALPGPGRRVPVAGQPGGHLFLIMASNEPLPANVSRNALDPSWHESPQTDLEIRLGNTPVRVAAVRLGVRAALDAQ